VAELVTAEEWVHAYSQSGAFDLLGSVQEAITLISCIQRQAVELDRRKIAAEAEITINGRTCTVAQSLTMRVALEAFASDLWANRLGDDKHGLAMVAAYLARLDEVRAMIFREVP
jgi:hypothetical protein